MNGEPLHFISVSRAVDAGGFTRGTCTHQPVSETSKMQIPKALHLLTCCQFSTSGAETSKCSSEPLVYSTHPGKFLQILCNKCTAEVGEFSKRVGSVSLFKWQVNCSTKTPAEPAPTGPECLAASLLANISRSGCAKSLISSHLSEGNQDSQLLLFLWVLNFNVVYSSSSAGGKRTAMKILYRQVTSQDGKRLVESIASDVQELNLPSATIHLVRHALESSSLLLPERERCFKEWHVGLLDRWNNNF